MAVRILSSDLASPELEALIAQGDGDGTLVPAAAVRTSGSGLTGLAGALHVKAIPVPGIMALHARWHTGDEDVVMKDEIPSRAINIQFQIGGELQANFGGLKHPLDMVPGRHNLIYAPDTGDASYVKRHSELEMLHISIERDYFAELIGAESAWCERILRELEAERPFSGVYGTGAVTPAMMQLIQGISMPQRGESSAMRRLQVHARLLDLLALQVGQFVAGERPGLTARAVPAADAERLYLLKAYLDKHFLEEHSLTQLAQQFLLNEFKLKAGFRQLFGTTVFGYLKALRMNYAALLLRDQRQAVEEVAYTLGYEHAHHFSAAFKKHFGNSPVQWLKG